MDSFRVNIFKPAIFVTENINYSLDGYRRVYDDNHGEPTGKRGGRNGRVDANHSPASAPIRINTETPPGHRPTAPATTTKAPETTTKAPETTTTATGAQVNSDCQQHVVAGGWHELGPSHQPGAPETPLEGWWRACWPHRLVFGAWSRARQLWLDLNRMIEYRQKSGAYLVLLIVDYSFALLFASRLIIYSLASDQLTEWLHRNYIMDNSLLYYLRGGKK